MGSPLFKITIVCGLILFSTQAHPVDTMIPLGTSEALEGGLSIGRIGSTIGLLTNPALLGGVSNSSVSASGNSYFMMRAKNRDNNGEASSFSAIPNSTIGAWKFQNGTLAAGIIVPMRLDLKLTLAGRGIFGASGDSALRSSIQQERTLAGIGWGQRLEVCSGDCANQWWIGASVFASYFTNQTRSNYSVESSTETIVSSVEQSSETASLLAVLGIAHQPSARFSWGVRISPPSVLLRTEQRGESRSYSYNASRTPSPFIASSSNSPGSVPGLDQWEFGLGSQWQVGRETFLLSEAFIREATRSINSNSSSLNGEGGAGFGARHRLERGYTLHGGSYFDLGRAFVKNTTTETRSVFVRLAAGLSWINKDFESGLGAFTMRQIVLEESSTRSLFEDSGTDYYGAMISGSYRF